MSVMQDLLSLCSWYIAETSGRNIAETSGRNYLLLNEWGCDFCAGLDGETAICANPEGNNEFLFS